MRVTVSRPTAMASDVIADLRRAALADPAAAMRCGLLAMRAHREEAAMPLLRAAATKFKSHAGLAQVFGLAARNLGDLDTACAALSHARSVAPTDALIAHGIARTRLEAGLPAIDDFHIARRLAPNDGSIILGLTAARFAERDIAGAIDEVMSVLAREPLWLEGHATLARLRRTVGDGDALASYRTALARMPQAGALWHALLATLAAAERFADLSAIVAAARRAAPDTPGLALYEAIAADETGDVARAGAWFDAIPADNDNDTIVHRVRSLLRRGRIADAAALAERGTRQPGGAALWPYLALAWRLLDDPRWNWLEGNPAFVRVYDLGDAIGDVDALAARLRTLHIATEQPLDQSVRGGTQTDGPLFSRLDPEIRRLRGAVQTVVADYIAGLPLEDAAHPLLSARRDPIRFAGSWSIRLMDGGHHADHMHSQGWISSALYVALPETIGGDDHAGWLTLGASSGLLPQLAPFRRIEPKVGRLVLFPSTMWHGTNRFAAGERLTVAFDVARLA